MQLQQAHSIAMQLVEWLSPFCDRIDIAGSIRRECATVSDIEIVLMPKMFVECDLFGEPISSKRDARFVNALKEIGDPIRGNPLDGRYVRRKVNNTDIEVDVFIPQPHDYYRILAIRTGSSKYAHNVIANGWLKKGWCGTPSGLRLIKECVGKPDGKGGTTWHCVAKSPTLPPIWESEGAFFTWLGIPFIKPKQRV